MKKYIGVTNIEKIALVIFATIFLVSNVSVASAANTSNSNGYNESILLSPTSKRYNLNAGSSVDDTIKIVNDGKSNFGFITYARPYSVNDEKYAPDFTSKAQNADAYKWVQFKQPSYQVKSGKTVDVPYTIRIPKDATPGGHYGVLFVETQPIDDQSATNSIFRKKRLGAILYITVKGDVQQSGRFENTNVPFFQFKPPLMIRQRVTNSGNTDFAVRSNVKVSDVFGNLKFRSEKEVVVLPASTRAIENDWLNPAWLGVYKVEQTAQFLDTNKSSTNYVLLVPIWVYVTLIVLIGGRILYAVFRRRTSKKK